MTDMKPEAINLIIAIDGPAAAGKSTLGRILAEKLDYLFFDTGVMYRTATLAGLNAGIDLNDIEIMGTLANEIHIDVLASENATGLGYSVLLDGEDVTGKIHNDRVESCVSIPSANPHVREAMTVAQRRIALRGHVVMVGRDIGTVVIPEAPVKLYITASVETRARRRYEERVSGGVEADYDEILESMRRRDRIDSSREVAPLKSADDAVVIDTTEMTMAELVEKSALLITKRTGITINLD